jgi:hypothetical protein
MNVPGFTAGASLYKTNSNYGTTSSAANSAARDEGEMRVYSQLANQPGGAPVDKCQEKVQRHFDCVFGCYDKYPIHDDNQKGNRDRRWACKDSCPPYPDCAFGRVVAAYF